MKDKMQSVQYAQMDRKSQKLAQKVECGESLILISVEKNVLVAGHQEE